MNQPQAETAVTTSALVVGATYAYRKLTEGMSNAAAAARSEANLRKLGHTETPPVGGHFKIDPNARYGSLRNPILAGQPRPTPTVKGTAAGVIGVGELLPLGTWITGAGVTYIVLSILTSINANLGGSFAILVATGAVLGNGQAVIADVNQGLQRPQGEQPAQPPVK